MSFPTPQKRQPANPADALTHGNLYQYHRGCRCQSCRAAYSEHRKVRWQELKRGNGDFLVSAELCREHLLWLHSQGVGKNAVAEASGIDEFRIRKIRNGKTKRVRMSTEQRIMRVDCDVRLDGSLVPSGPTHRRIEHLRSLGYSQEILGKLLGYQRPALQFFGSPRITARTESRIERLYKRLVRSATAPCPLSDAVIIPAARTWEQIEALQSEGFTKAEIWRRLGYKGTTLRIGKDRVRLRTAHMVERLYRELMAGAQEDAA